MNKSKYFFHNIPIVIILVLNIIFENLKIVLKLYNKCDRTHSTRYELGVRLLQPCGLSAL